MKLPSGFIDLVACFSFPHVCVVALCVFRCNILMTKVGSFMVTHRVMDCFEPTKNDWQSYTEQLEQYFIADEVPMGVKQ